MNGHQMDLMCQQFERNQEQMDRISRRIMDYAREQIHSSGDEDLATWKLEALYGSIVAQALQSLFVNSTFFAEAFEKAVNEILSIPLNISIQNEKIESNHS